MKQRLIFRTIVALILVAVFGVTSRCRASRWELITAIGLLMLSWAMRRI